MDITNRYESKNYNTSYHKITIVFKVPNLKNINLLFYT